MISGDGECLFCPWFGSKGQMGPPGRGSFLGELPPAKGNRGPALGVVGESQNTKLLGACILCRWSERLQEEAMGQAGLREREKFPGSQRDQGAATKEFPELNEKKAETIACLQRQSSMHLIQVDSVQRWMEDLKLMTDCECMCILQSKPISIEKDEQNELILSSQYSTCDNLQLLLKRAWIISTELTRIAQKLEKNRWQRVHSMTVRVNCHVRSMINEYNTFTRNSSEEMHQFEKLLIDKCSEFTAFTERCIQTEDEQILKAMKSCINETLTTVAQYFGQLIELVLTQEAQNLLRQIELSDNVYMTETAISSLFSLTQEGAHLCRIIAK
ncbi:PREDICTED: protein inscuteable homolog, partial [Fulmarus glacialis]|uniref:protein inscuteable homolog n=1 Tax=Fulmarus glacialis TaxID=30455 RepID=UPI00051C7FEB